MGASGEGSSPARGLQEPEQPSTNPWNIMIKHRQVARRGRRSQMAVSFTNPNISMDLLRAVLQPHINEEIRAVINKYTKFFQKAAWNVKENIGEDVDPEQLVQETCKNCLEQAKMMYSDGGKMITKPVGELSATKRKGRPPGHLISFDRTTPSAAVSKVKYTEPIKREGPKWDPARLNTSTTFVLGSRANKALGMGGTRGRIYIKHPELFKYSADSQDKHWLGEKHHMPATGGKMAYLLIEDDIRELAASDDYR
ncbi:deoxynucleotidyltransferase terminal-interacting protein 1 isoform X2 [Heptranchias perlo]|uniref:deoxynucleotidyltransferase terminal-interacting protein 1 isoform X2 n=1 Tax=Heptranchias perlo TaxID=212740 RepID=UPI0035599253